MEQVLREQHTLVKTKATKMRKKADGTSFTETVRRNCVVCYKEGRTKTTSFKCSQCGIALCVPTSIVDSCLSKHTDPKWVEANDFAPRKRKGQHDF